MSKQDSSMVSTLEKHNSEIKRNLIISPSISLLTSGISYFYIKTYSNTYNPGLLSGGIFYGSVGLSFTVGTINGLIKLNKNKKRIKNIISKYEK